MKTDQMFPSRYIKASDIGQGQYRLTIKNLSYEDMADGEKKWVIYFNGTNKGLVLNRTNANALEWLYGDETDNWIGKAVEVYTEMTTYMGKAGLGVRLRGPGAITSTRPAAAPEQPGQPAGPGEQAAVQAKAGFTPPEDDLDDEIPF